MSISPQRPPGPSRHWSFRVLKRLLIGFAILLGLLLIALLTLALWPDIEPPKDDDLEPHSQSIDVSGGNPVDSLLALTVEITDEENRAAQKDGRTGESPDLVEVYADALVRNREPLELLRRVGSESNWKHPHVYDMRDFSDYLNELTKGCNLLRISSLGHLEKAKSGTPGAADRAVEEALHILRLSKRCEQGGGGLLHKLVAMTCWSFGTKALFAILDDDVLSSEELAVLALELDPLRLDPVDYADAYRFEYQSMSRLFDGLADGTITAEQLQIHQPHSAPKTRSLAQRGKAAFLQPNRSKQRFAEAMRSAIRDATEVRKELVFEKEVIDPLTEEKVKMWPLFLSPNAVGKIMHSIALPVHSGIMERHALAGTQHDFLRIRVAALRYRKEVGGVVADLSSLVPKYLEAIPMDLFDGEVLRFNPETGRVYSIGIDFVDQGGTWSYDRAIHWNKRFHFSEFEHEGRSPYELKGEPAMPLFPEMGSALGGD